MRKQIQWRILGIMAVCAIICYAIGLIAGVIAFVTIGAIFELLFWFGAFRKFQKFKK